MEYKMKGTIKQVRRGYSDNTIEVFIISDSGTFLNIVPRIDVHPGDEVKCTMYSNLYSTQVESIELI